MGYLALLTTLSAVLGAVLAAPAAPQEPDPLALRAAELREPEAGELVLLEDLSAALIGLIDSQPQRAEKIVWEQTLDDLCAGFQARGKERSWCTFVSWQVALAWRTAGDVERARALLEPLVPELTADDAYACWVLIELADLARHAGRWGEARGFVEGARARLVPPGGDPFAHRPQEREQALALAVWFDVSGQFFHELGQSELAARHFTEGFARARELDDDALWWSFVDDRVMLALGLGRYDEVEALWQALPEAGAWHRAAAAERAKLTIHRAHALVEREQRGELERGAAREALLAVLEEPGVFAHDALDACILLATEALDAGEAAEARDWLESAREQRAAGVGGDLASRAVFGLASLRLRLARLEGGRLGEVLAAERAVFERFLATWSDAPTAARGVGFLQAAWRNQFLGEWLELQLAALPGAPEGARNAAEDLLAVQALGTLTRAMDAPAVELVQVQGELARQGAAALVYAPAREATLAFALDGEQVRVFRLAPAHELARARRALEECATAAVAGEDSARLERAVRVATAAFLPPSLWEALAPVQEIVVVGAVGAGVFGLELLQPEGETPLGESRAVSHLPSLPLGVALSAAASDGARAGVVLVAPAEAGPAPPWDDFPSISLDASHAQRLLELYGREHSTLLDGAAATRAALTEPLRGAEAASIVTHGLFDPARARPAGLLLAGGHALWCEDVEALAVPPFVSLVACGAARGRERRGDDGRTHLGAAFLRAGARAVVLARTDVEAELGHFLDAEMHAGLRRGLSPAAALRDARMAAHSAGMGGAGRVQAALVHVYGLGTLPLFAGGLARAPASTSTPASRGGALALLALGLVVLLLVLVLVLVRRRTPGGT